MARRKKRASRWRPPFSFYLLLFGLGAFTAYRFRDVVIDHLHVIVPVLALLLFLLLFRWHQRLRLASDLEAIDRMNGHEFERFLVRLFQKHGYQARNVGASGGDFGADLVIEKAGIKIAVQAKNYTTGKVGNDAVQQAIAGATFYDCDQAMVVTNARYTKSAYRQATGCRHFPVTLWDRDEIQALIKD